MFGISSDYLANHVKFASRALNLYKRRHGVINLLGIRGIHEGTGLGTLGVCFNGVTMLARS